MHNSQKPIKNGANSKINKDSNSNVSHKSRIHSGSNDDPDFELVQHKSKRNLSSNSSDFKAETIKKNQHCDLIQSVVITPTSFPLDLKFTNFLSFLAYNSLPFLIFRILIIHFFSFYLIYAHIFPYVFRIARSLRTRIKYKPTAVVTKTAHKN